MTTGLSAHDKITQIKALQEIERAGKRNKLIYSEIAKQTDPMKLQISLGYWKRIKAGIAARANAARTEERLKK